MITTKAPFLLAATIVLVAVIFLSGTLSPITLREDTIASNTNDNVLHSETFNSSQLPYLPETAYILHPNETTYYQIIQYNDNEGLLRLAHTLMKGQFCNQIKEWIEEEQTILVNVTFSCQAMFDHSGMGSGNIVLAFYALRMVAHTVGHIHVQIQCSDAEQTQKELLLPWLTGFFPAVEHIVPRDMRNRPTVEEACTHFNRIALGYMIPAMRYDMRRMALALVGVPDQLIAGDKNTSFYTNTPPDGANMRLSVNPQEPLYPSTELDEVVLHFRCGDLINSDHKSFGFMSFQSFSRHISPEARSIGIVTQPFDAKDAQMRPLEQTSMHIDRCRLVVTKFVQHLEEQFSQARIRIRNDVNETIALTVARMIMAKQTITAISTFSVVPALATFGSGYIREPDFDKAPNWFLMHPNVSTLVDNVYLIQEPVLMAAELKKMWGDDGSAALEWFQNGGDDG